MRQPGRKKSSARLANLASAGKTLPTASPAEQPSEDESAAEEPAIEAPGLQMAEVSGTSNQGQHPKLPPHDNEKLPLPENMSSQSMDMPILEDIDIPGNPEVQWQPQFLAYPVADEMEALRAKVASLGAQMAKRITAMETALNQSLGDIPHKCADPLKTKLDEIKKMISKWTTEVVVLRKRDAEKQEVIKDLKTQVEGYKVMVTLQTEKINSMSKSNEQQEANILALTNLTQSSVDLQVQAKALMDDVNKEVLATKKAAESAQKYASSSDRYVKNHCLVLQTPSTAELEVVSEEAMHLLARDFWRERIAAGFKSKEETKEFLQSFIWVTSQRNIQLVWMDKDGAVAVDPDETCTIMDYNAEASFSSLCDHRTVTNHWRKVMGLSLSTIARTAVSGRRLGFISDDLTCERCHRMVFLNPRDKGNSKEVVKVSNGPPPPKIHTVCDSCLPKCQTCRDLIRKVDSLLEFVNGLKETATQIAGTKLLEMAVSTPLSDMIATIRAFSTDPTEHISHKVRRTYREDSMAGSTSSARQEKDTDELSLHPRDKDRKDLYQGIPTEDTDSLSKSSDAPGYVPDNPGYVPDDPGYVPTPINPGTSGISEDQLAKKRKAKNKSGKKKAKKGRRCSSSKSSASSEEETEDSSSSSSSSDESEQEEESRKKKSSKKKKKSSKQKKKKRQKDKRKNFRKPSKAAEVPVNPPPKPQGEQQPIEPQSLQAQRPPLMPPNEGAQPSAHTMGMSSHQNAQNNPPRGYGRGFGDRGYRGGRGGRRGGRNRNRHFKPPNTLEGMIQRGSIPDAVNLLLFNQLANQRPGHSQQSSQDGQNGQGPAH